MPLVRVSMFPGRTTEQKAALVDKITDALVETCGASRDGVWIVLEEVPQEHWGVGGQLCSAPTQP